MVEFEIQVKVTSLSSIFFLVLSHDNLNIGRMIFVFNAGAPQSVWHVDLNIARTIIYLASDLNL